MWVTGRGGEAREKTFHIEHFFGGRLGQFFAGPTKGLSGKPNVYCSRTWAASRRFGRPRSKSSGLCQLGSQSVDRAASLAVHGKHWLPHAAKCSTWNIPGLNQRLILGRSQECPPLGSVRRRKSLCSIRPNKSGPLPPDRRTAVAGLPLANVAPNRPAEVAPPVSLPIDRRARGGASRLR